MGASFPTRPGRPMGVFTLVMINVIAVNNLASLSFNASFGPALFTVYAAVTLCFLAPLALIAAELASTWPEQGGIYAWVKHAFGPRWGFFVIWLQWIYNVAWYPTILTFLAQTLLPDAPPHLLLPIIWGMFAVATATNIRGVRVSSHLSTLGSLLNTLLPMLVLIALGCTALVQHGLSSWLAPFQNQPMAYLWPQSNPHQQLDFLLALMFGMVGIEMSAVHAKDVKNPRQAYPRAIAWSIGVIALSQVLSGVAISIVIPRDQMNIVTGVMQAFKAFFHIHGWNWLTPIITGLIIFGGFSSVSAWLLGPAKGVMQAAQDGWAPPSLGRTNRWGAPIALLGLQSLLFAGLSALYILLPSIQDAYEQLTVMTTQLSLVAYVVMVAAAWRMRHLNPQPKPGDFRIPGGVWGFRLMASLGLLSSAGAFLLGFFNTDFHKGVMILMLMVAALITPWWLTRRKP